MRDKNNIKKLEPLKKYFGECLNQVEFVNLNLDDSKSIDEALKGADFVVHTASPVGANPKDHDEMIRPAVNGVRSILEACSRHKIKRIVITSSGSAVTCMAEADRP